ncbi:uncharacterized protein LOC103460035 isoform X2 [Poecilia reticulata]|uniref:uncharacterized protein LOC103460035 isoform X2 n=1 Tax=Poecilia reticulata TaxID=8081 RepID=UPI0007EB1949|nr:PREDICTED: uncharacterized protein LOC103460035 isoform X2 [Poecilia reticulata]
MMSGPNPSSQNHADDAGPGDESLDPEPLLDPNQQPVLCSWTGQGDSSWSPDGDQPRYGGLDRKWVLWHEFMQEHAHLDAWLRLAEQAVNTLSPAHLTYSASKEELRRFQRLRSEAGSQLIRLDGLTRRNRTLPRLFQGAVQVRLLGAARECGRRWDEVDAKLETITGRLQRCVSEWEEFEAEREELALWLADMDARLTAIHHMAGSNCDKLRELRSFQQVLCENSGRVNDLLRRGEELIQRREPADARRVESHLLELLRRCSHVYDNIARTHTRLLSTVLVFDGVTVLTRPADSGYPSESVLQSDLDPSSVPTDLRGEPSENHQLFPSDFRQSMNATPTGPARRPPTPPPSPSHEHLGLEWDPSVDIGRSLSHDDADSSYFSVCTGLCQPDETKRWSYLSSFDSRSDITADITNQEAALEWTDQPEPGLVSPVTSRQEEDQWAASSPEADLNKPMRFDGGRVKAWLRVQSSAPAEMTTSCSRAVQTDGDGKEPLQDVLTQDLHVDSWRRHGDSWRRHGDRQRPLPAPSSREPAGAAIGYLQSALQVSPAGSGGAAVELSPRRGRRRFDSRPGDLSLPCHIKAIRANKTEMFAVERRHSSSILMIYFLLIRRKRSRPAVMKRSSVSLSPADLPPPLHQHSSSSSWLLLSPCWLASSWLPWSLPVTVATGCHAPSI